MKFCSRADDLLMRQHKHCAGGSAQFLSQASQAGLGFRTQKPVAIYKHSRDSGENVGKQQTTNEV